MRLYNILSTVTVKPVQGIIQDKILDITIVIGSDDLKQNALNYATTEQIFCKNFSQDLSKQK